MEKVTFIGDNNEELELFVLEETEIKEKKYILAAESEEDDSTAYILKETESDGEESTFEIVEDDLEFDSVLKVFEELMDDVDFDN